MFYVLRDQPEMSATLYRLIPPAYREDARHMIMLLDSLLGSYLRGQLVLCLSVGIMTTIGLTMLGVDLALLLGTLAGIFEVVPVLGPLLGAIPAILVTLAASPSNLLWVIALAFVVQQIENYCAGTPDRTRIDPDSPCVGHSRVDRGQRGRWGVGSDPESAAHGHGS